MARIEDIEGNFYEVTSLNNFIEHIDLYHTIKGLPDNSIHEENGHYFKVDNQFYSTLIKLKNENN